MSERTLRQTPLEVDILPGCNDDISVKHDGDLSDGELDLRLREIFDGVPWWARPLVVVGIILLMVIFTIVNLPRAVVNGVCGYLRRRRSGSVK